MSIASGGDAAVVLGEQRVPRRDLVDRGARAASALASAGVREGDAIALLLQNDPVYFELIHAAALLLSLIHI